MQAMEFKENDDVTSWYNIGLHGVGYPIHTTRLPAAELLRPIGLSV